MQCFTCEKIAGNSRREMVTICGHCREVLKVDLVMVVLKLDPIYLSESNRHKGGRPSKLSADRRYEASLETTG